MNINNSKILLLIRTPFQAWIALQVIEVEAINDYGLVYITQNDSKEDKHYYEILAKKSSVSQYCYVPIWRYDVLNHLIIFAKTYSWRKFHSLDLYPYNLLKQIRNLNSL